MTLDAVRLLRAALCVGPPPVAPDATAPPCVPATLLRMHTLGAAGSVLPYLSRLGSAIDIDGNGSLSALTDGLLILRWMFGLTGTTLTNGVIGGGCTGCDADAIVPYLVGLAG